jgi:hydrogenase maturation protein HypF
MLVETCTRLRDECKLNRIALSGGCFQNTYILSGSIERLTGEGFEVFYPQMIPPNDGGLSLGQALIANELLTSTKD